MRSTYFQWYGQPFVVSCEDIHAGLRDKQCVLSLCTSGESLRNSTGVSYKRQAWQKDGKGDALRSTRSSRQAKCRYRGRSL